MIVTDAAGVRWSIAWDQPADYGSLWLAQAATDALAWSPAEIREASTRDSESVARLRPRIAEIQNDEIHAGILNDLVLRADLYRVMAECRPEPLDESQPGLF